MTRRKSGAGKMMLTAAVVAAGLWYFITKGSSAKTGTYLVMSVIQPYLGQPGKYGLRNNSDLTQIQVPWSEVDRAGGGTSPQYIIGDLLNRLSNGTWVKIDKVDG